MTVAVLIVAAGRGTRAGSGRGPKQYALLGGVPMLSRTLAVFATHPRCDMIQVVIHPDDAALYQTALEHTRAALKVVAPVIGGASRQASGRCS